MVKLVMTKKLIGFAFIMINTWPALAQETQHAPYPKTFTSFKLGMSLDTVKYTLSQSSDFLWKGDPDVTLLSRPNTHLIDVPGRGFLQRGIFQFYENSLHIMTLELNPQELDYYTMYITLAQKYGPPTSLDPATARWEDEEVRFTLEKPLQVKYIDKPVFLKLQKESTAEQSMKKLIREKFLENF